MIRTIEVQRIKRCVILGVVCAIVSLSGCTANHRQAIEQAKINQAKEDLENVSDPLEPINRLMWDFNRDVLDKFILKPVAQGYVYITPQPVRTGLLNAATNIEEPANSINNLLQGKPEDSFASFSRFLINSTVGILGIFDVASKMGIEQQEEEFAQVLGAHGIDSGPYLMLPFFGPRDTRGFVGNVVDRFNYTAIPYGSLATDYSIGKPSAW
ncbi:VacJ family lipoprotein [Ningiella sp. W23]|uniref:MlaA family lipoprotein n=1 Tax=Ningiella sp. W23 TaxID=3023715 RepID=UPI00375780D1